MADAELIETLQQNHLRSGLEPGPTGVNHRCHEGAPFPAEGGRQKIAAAGSYELSKCALRLLLRITLGRIGFRRIAAALLGLRWGRSNVLEEADVGVERL